MNKKAVTPIIAWVVLGALSLIFIKPLFIASSTTAGLFKNPIIIFLILIGFFLWATRGK